MSCSTACELVLFRICPMSMQWKSWVRYNVRTVCTPTHKGWEITIVLLGTTQIQENTLICSSSSQSPYFKRTRILFMVEVVLVLDKWIRKYIFLCWCVVEFCFFSIHFVWLKKCRLVILPVSIGYWPVQSPGWKNERANSWGKCFW